MSQPFVIEQKQADGSYSELIPLGYINRNELDNSNFANPVNQRGVSGTISTVGYCIDRWKLVSGSMALSADGIILNGTIAQILEHAAGSSTTTSVGTVSGTATAAYNNATKTLTLTSAGGKIKWVKLELGNIATPYVPKGYGAELAECRRYYLKMDPVVKVYCNDVQYGQPRVSLSLGTVMRVTPTFTLTQGYKSSNLASTSVDGTKTTAYLTLNPSAAGMLQSNSVVEASADL